MDKPKVEAIITVHEKELIIGDGEKYHKASVKVEQMISEIPRCKKYLVRYVLDEGGGLHVISSRDRMLHRNRFQPVCPIPRSWLGKKVRREVIILEE